MLTSRGMYMTEPYPVPSVMSNQFTISTLQGAHLYQKVLKPLGAKYGWTQKQLIDHYRDLCGLAFDCYFDNANQSFRCLLSLSEKVVHETNTEFLMLDQEDKELLKKEFLLFGHDTYYRLIVEKLIQPEHVLVLLYADPHFAIVEQIYHEWCSLLYN